MPVCTIQEERLRADNVQLMINDGGYVKIAGQMNLDVTLTNGAVDMTVKSDRGDVVNIAGNTGWTATTDGAMIFDDTTIDAIYSAIKNKTLVCIAKQVENPSGAIRFEAGCAVVTRFNTTAPKAGGHMFAADFAGSGPWTIAPCA